MTGKIVSVEVAEGASVADGQLVVVMEAMKMEYRLSAPHAGVIESIHCQPGELVDLGTTLVTLAETETVSPKQ